MFQEELIQQRQSSSISAQTGRRKTEQRATKRQHVQKARCPTLLVKTSNVIRFVVQRVRPIIFGLKKDQKVYPWIKSKWTNWHQPWISNFRNRSHLCGRMRFEFTAQSATLSNSIYYLSIDGRKYSLIPLHLQNWRVHSGNVTNEIGKDAPWPGGYAISCAAESIGLKTRIQTGILFLLQDIY